MSIFGSLFSDKSTDDLFNRLDDVIEKLPASQGSHSDSDDLTTSVINTAIDLEKNEDKEQILNIFKDLKTPDERLKRYELYETIYSSVQLIKRIITVYNNNIFDKDSITNNIFQIRESEGVKDPEKIKRFDKFSRNCIKFFKLEELFKNRIGLPLLLYGDAFIEIVEVDKLDVDYSKYLTSTKDKSVKVITETIQHKLNSTNEYNQINENDIDSLVDLIVEFDSSGMHKQIYEQENPTEDSFSKISLKFHYPHSIVPLTTEFETVLGYVEIREVDKLSTERSNPLKSFLDVANKMSSSLNATSKSFNKQERHTDTVNLFVKSVIKKVISEYVKAEDIDSIKDKKEKNEEIAKRLKKSVQDDFFHSVSKLLLSVDDSIMFKKKLNIRFISTDNMVSFTTPTTAYWPYGQPIIDSLVYPGKLYLLTQMANTVIKLSRASLIRKWNVEVGVREDHSVLLQKLKNEFRNSRITAGDLASSTKNIPNILSDFKDIITLTRKQNKFIDVDILQTGDPNIRINDLEDQRREIVAISGVPQQFLGYNETYELRERLIHSNVVFAKEISSYQDVINKGLTNLIDKIGQKIGYEEESSKYVKVYLQPPVILLLQLVEATISSTRNILSYFTEHELQTEPYYMLKRFVPFIDWDEFRSESESYVQKLKVNQAVVQAQAMTQQQQNPQMGV